MTLANESLQQVAAPRVVALRRASPGLARVRGVARRGAVDILSMAGAALVLGSLWQLASMAAEDLPTPLATLAVLAELLRDPLHDGGPNDKGVGLQLFASLSRVFLGFALASVVAVPLGVLIGANNVIRRVVDPIVQVLRPVSPLAWFPIGLVALQSAPHAAVFVVFITSLWPTVVNTAVGVASVPRAYRDLARVFEFSRAQYLTRVLLPYALPHILTGLRLSMGIAWLVIVAAEMLSGGTGIGFFVWDSWNALSLERVISAILLIGIVGLALDRVFGFVADRFKYAEVA